MYTPLSAQTAKNFIYSPMNTYCQVTSMVEGEEGKREPKNPSRREFIAAVGGSAAGLVVGGVVGSQLFPKVEVTEVTKEEYVCPYCDQKFSSEVELGNHIKTAHPDLVTKEVVKEVAKYPCPYCDQVFDTEEALGNHIKTAHPDLVTKEVVKEVEKPPQTIKMTVNGRQYEFIVGDEVEPNTTLRDLLRERVGLTSPKDMCHGEGACGSCTVIVNGRPVLSCLTLAMDCDGKTIETAEGIADSGHPIFEAYTKYHTMQCGYCTPGFLVTAKALLDRNPNPTEEDIIEALAGNICRCGTYPEHVKAVLEAAQKLKGG